MDKARGREFVERLPAASRDELLYKEQVYDKQVLLNEEWHTYASRTGKSSAAAQEEHVKWITETWEEYEARKRNQAETLAHYDAEAQVDMRRKATQIEVDRARSDQVIARLMKFRNDANATQTPSRHHLYADFDEYQRVKFAREQLLFATAESLVRAQIENWQDGLTELLREMAVFDRFCKASLQCDREAKEEAERKRLEEARQRAMEEERRREQERKRLEEEEAQRKKEQAELEKRMERKRREEERRAKARADRARQKELEAAPAVTVDEQADAMEHRDSAALVAQDEFVDCAGTQRSRIEFRPLTGDNIITLFKSLTNILSSGGDDCYVMAIRKEPCASSVICQNGHFLGDENESAAPLLGKRIDSASCVSVSSEKLHTALESAADFESFIQFHVENVEDVLDDDRCMLFRATACKVHETLLLYPVFCEGIAYSPYIVGFCRPDARSITEAENRQIAELVFALCERLAALQRQTFLHQLCQQCVEWLNVSTGCDNVYVSLSDSSDDSVLTYVAATESHRYMIGKRHSRSEESNNRGISFCAMEKCTPEQRVHVYSVPNVADTSGTPFEGRSIRYYTDGDKKGPLLVSPITGVKNSQGESVGVVFLDRIGSKKNFSATDIEITRAATQLLADIILGNEAVPAMKLKIEDEMGGGPLPIAFLKVLWHKSREELDQITPNQLLELGKYLHPPPIIPVVVQATVLVAVGCKPRSIENWDDARKRVTRKLLDKMLIFDPTDTKARKRAFFIRSRKLLKGMTADAVFEKGSYPTQCFFKWTFTALLLRKHAETIQKQLKDAGGKEMDAASLFSNSTVGADSIDEDDNFDDVVDDPNEE